MARLEYMTRDKLSAEYQPIWDELAGGRERMPPFTELLMYRPPMAALAEHLGRSLRLESVVPRATVELVVLMVARELDCRREWAAHINQARNAGAREDAIQAIGHRQGASALAEEEALLQRYVQELLHNRRVTNETFAAVRERLGDVGIVDITALIGFYSLAASVLNAFEVDPPDNPDLQLPD